MITGVLAEPRVQPGDWDWTAISADATALAAIVTAITMVFIARQTIATRKSARQAERSADASFQALAYAQRQQDYAAAQHQQSLFMAAEALKSRIDAEMPRITVTGLRRGEPYIDPAEVLRPPATQMSEHANGRIKMGYTVAFSLHNDGHRNVEVSFSSPVFLDGAESTTATKVVVPPDGSCEVQHRVFRTLAEWAAINRVRQTGEPGDVDRLEIRYGSDGDTSGHDNQYIESSGTPIEASTIDPVHWQLGGEIGVSLMPAVRTYWLSRYRNQRVPEIEWADLGVPEPVRPS